MPSSAYEDLIAPQPAAEREARVDATIAIMRLCEESGYACSRPVTRESALTFVEQARQRLQVIALAAAVLP